MKMKMLFLMALMAATLFTTSCSEDETIEPTGETNTKVEFTYDYIDEATVEFTSAEGGKSVVWDLGDGTTMNGRTIEHKYKNTGTYPVKLIVEKEGETLNGEEEVAIEISDDYMLAQNWEIVAARKGLETVPKAQGARFWLRQDGSYSIGSIDGFFWRWNEDKSGVIMNSGTANEITWNIKELSMDKFHVEFISFQGDDWTYFLEPVN